jgi:DNA-binding NarL/FixJ family response regulator
VGSTQSGADRGRGPLLIVDDDDRFRSFVATTLSGAGFAAHGVASGERALAFARTDPPALVMLDVCLPGINGFEVCRQLRDEFGDELPIIFVSADKTDPFDRSAGLLIGGDDYLFKPIDPNELLARVRRLLARSRPEQTVATSPKFGLTKRELAVLERLAKGRPQLEIAAELVISPNTVANHVQHILTKLAVHSRAQAVAFAYDHGLLEGQAARPINWPPLDSDTGPDIS